MRYSLLSGWRVLHGIQLLGQRHPFRPAPLCGQCGFDVFSLYPLEPMFEQCRQIFAKVEFSAEIIQTQGVLFRVVQLIGSKTTLEAAAFLRCF